MGNDHAIVRPGSAATGEQSPAADAGNAMLQDATAVDLLGRILSEVIQLRLEFAADRETTKNRPASPQTDISEREFDRRVQLLAANARTNPSTGNVNCALCGSPHKSGQSLRRHIRRYHHADVRRLPADSKLLAT